MIKDFKKNIEIVKYVFKFCPFYAIFTLVYIIFQAIATLSKVYLVERIVKIIENIIENNSSDIKNVITIIAIYIVIIIVCNIYNSIYQNYIKGKYRIIFIKSMRTVMFKKAKEVDYESFDNPEFYDRYSWAMREISRGIIVYEDFSTFISSLVNTFMLGAFIGINDIILITIILISVISRLIITQKVNKNTHRFNEETERDRRMFGYVNRTFYQERFAAEMKSTDISCLLIDRCKESQNNIDKKYLEIYKENTILKIISSIIANIFELAGMYIYLAYKLFKGLAVSTFSAIISAASQFSSNLYSMANFFIRIKTNALYIDYILDYMNYKPKLETIGMEDLDDKFESLEVKNVSFAYPISDKNALTNINLKLERKEKIAIVGLNGAGKTTLIKLLLKFYNPKEGDILYNGKSIKNAKEDVLRKKYAIVFQDYRIYGVTIGENILMRKIANEEDEKRVWTALEYVGMKEKITKLPQGINTICTREFRSDGAVFSGGELQRIAIARAFASNAYIFILDEPTSNLDPLAEKRINNLIIEKAKDKAVILIAHRLSTVVDADRIILIEYGKIIEEGTHVELIEKKGKYFEMFTTQSYLYKSNKGDINSTE